MREHDVRRIPVVEDGGRPAGIVSIGDLALANDEESVLADISSAPPDK
jgi:CBS domain-containing protein